MMHNEAAVNLARSRTAFPPALRVLFAATILRVFVFITATHLTPASFTSFANKGDGASYVAYARSICGDAKAMTDYDRRVFPGFPALIALLHAAGVPFAMAALNIDWLCSGFAAAFALQLFTDRRIGWAMVFLVPHYLGNSTLAMSEAPLLAFSLGGVLLVFRNRLTLGGAALGYACLIRPMGCFAVGGVLLALWLERRWLRSALIALGVALVFGLGVAALYFFTGDVLVSFRTYRDSPSAYGGQIFEWPFHALLTVPWSDHRPLGFVVYIYAHVVIVLGACVLLARRAMKSSGTLKTLNTVALIWLVGNTAFQLCIGRIWGFVHFPRFAIPSQPALFWAICPWLPKTKWVWWVAAAGAVVLAVISVRTTT